MKIGFNGQKKGQHTFLDKTFEYLPEGYFSLGDGVSYYKNLKDLGDEVRERCVKGLNDVSYNIDLFDRLLNLQEEVFKTSLLRGVNEKNVKTQLHRIALGGSVLTEFNFSYPIDAKNRVSLDFDVMPLSLPPTNIHAIIGTNGSGKTTALKGIIRGYIEETLDEEFSNAIFISFSVFDKYINYESGDSLLSYFYVGVKGEDYKTKSHEEIKEEFKKSIKKIFIKKRYTYLYKMFEILSSDYNLKEVGIVDILDKFINTKNKNTLTINKYSGMLTKSFGELSSGHQIILLSISKIVELIVEKTLIIIDEPETHLHPPLLSSFIRALSRISIIENAVAILATHSPVVLQELPKSCVSIMRRYGSTIKVSPPRFETFGENIGKLTEEVFGLEIQKTGFHSLLREIVQEHRDYNKIIELFNDELSIDAKSVIRTYLNELDSN